VLEVGCGNGRLTAGFADEAASVFAFDPDAASVESARARLAGELAERVTFRVGTAREIEISRIEYDIVVFTWSL
jgi:2-polyprenyl-3-methyl-5-hydroxy-6-metoxy-1,4-benzoquinol methylase